MSASNSQSILNEDFKYEQMLVSGSKFLIGVRKIKDVRQVLLTNLSEFYEDNLVADDIVKRCEELNPVLIDPEFSEIEEIIDNLLVNIPKYAMFSSIENIRLENKVDGGRFKFEIKLKRSTAEYFKNNFMDSFYFAFSELYSRYNCLLDIVKKKDQEIAEYKAEGIELLRKSIVTEPFTETSFHNKLQNKKSYDKFNTFVQTLDFYNTLKNLKCNSDDMKQKITSKPDLCRDNIADRRDETRKTSKRLFTSDELRCAVAPKSQRTAQSSKRKNNKFEYL